MLETHYYEDEAQEEEIKKVAIYARKSRSHEGEKDLQNHLTRLIARCELNEWGYTIYKEIGSGGSLVDRPEMLKLLEDCKTNIYDAVVVVDIDRLSRGKGTDLDRILGVFKNHNVRIVQESPYDVYDLNNSNHAQMLEMKMFFGNMELMQAKKRYKEGKRLARYLGKWVDGVPPYGYQIDRKTKFLILDEHESKIMTLMKDYFLEVYNTVEVAWMLNKEGYRTRAGSEWTSSRVAKFLKNEVYTGTYIYNRGKGSWRHNNKEHDLYSSGIPYTRLDKSKWKRKEDNHPAIFTKEEYKRIMKHFNQITTPKSKSTYALTGLCKDTQGKHLTLIKSKGSMEYPDRIALSNIYNKTEKDKFIPVDIKIVYQSISASIQVFKESIAEKLKEKDNTKEIESVQNKIIEIKDEIEKIDIAIEKIQEGFIFGLYSATEAKDIKIKQEKKIEEKENELIQLNEQLSNLSNEKRIDRLGRINKFIKDIETADKQAELNRLYKNIISDIVIESKHKDEVKVTINFL